MRLSPPCGRPLLYTGQWVSLFFIKDQQMDKKKLRDSVFRIQSPAQFNQVAVEVFRYQYTHNVVYRKYCDALGVQPQKILNHTQIPFLPIGFFKNHRIATFEGEPKVTFTSSGTTGAQTSRHLIKDVNIYRESFVKAFEMFFGKPEEYHILALLPGYLERKGSSLVYMVHELIKLSNSPHSGFYLDELDLLQQKIERLEKDPRKVLLLGVSFALLDMAEKHPVNHPRLLVMETGGMKGRRKELVREELHDILCGAFGVENVASEYGMTELLSQAYSYGKGIFSTPPWMKVLIRDMNDPFHILAPGLSGGVSVIDLANLESCSFIATQDLGRQLPGNTFGITGRYDNSDVRGCNLMIE